MTQEEHIQYWIKSAEHDLSTAGTLVEAGKYDWALFLGHLVLEKGLKALFVRRNETIIPPKIHNLVRLAELSDLVLEEERKLFFDRVNDFNIEVRYPDYKNEFYKSCTKEFAENNFKEIKEAFEWIKSLLK
jgi:HEPN domain-containing protein